MRTLLMVALIAGLGLGGRKQRAEEQLRAAKQAYQDALAKTQDFECTAPEFDEVLRMLDQVPRATPARKQARDLARTIREKRAAAGRHAQALDRAASAPRAEPAAAKPPVADPASCKPARRRLLGLRAARKREGRPPLGEMTTLRNGEIGYTPGAEPSPEESALIRQIKVCEGQNPDEG